MNVERDYNRAIKSGDDINAKRLANQLISRQTRNLQQRKCRDDLANEREQEAFWHRAAENLRSGAVAPGTYLITLAELEELGY